MLAIGRSVFRPRLHSSRPVAATSIAADLAPTPAGPVAEDAALAAGTALAAAVSAAHAARTTPGRSRVTRTVGWTRASMDTPLGWRDNRGRACQLRHDLAIAPR